LTTDVLAKREFGPARVRNERGVLFSEEPSMNIDQSAAVRKANLHFRKEQQAREGAEAWNAYQAQAEATREKTMKLRAERLAREASARASAPAPKPAKKTTSRRA
jgi:hypothetical protein